MRIDPWDTGFVDLAGDQGLLGQREGRTGATVVEWLSQRSTAFREAVEYVAIDPAAAYASAIRTPGLLPNATLVVDHHRKHVVSVDPAPARAPGGKRATDLENRCDKIKEAIMPGAIRMTN